MYSIGEVSKMFDLPISTLRYYDKEGLFPDIVREPSGIRRFNDKTLEALREIPSDRLFFETDDSPAAIETIYARAAEVRQTTVEELRRATAENYRQLFGGGK